MHALVEDLDAVLAAALPDGRPALLAGHSLGAMTIVGWAGEHPERVRERAAGAVLANFGVGDLVSESLVFPAPRGRLKAAIGVAMLGARAPLPPASPITHRAVRYIALSPSASPAQVAFCQEMVLKCRRDVRAGAGRTLSALDLRGAVERLAVPTALVAGERDRLTPPRHAHRLAETLPDVAELRVLERIGHMAPVEAPDEVTRVIERLAARALGGRAAAPAGAGAGALLDVAGR